MPINPDAANEPPGPPSERSWNSKDALLYAVGVGAGSIDPTGFELEFTTENSKDIQQRVLPTFAVIVGMGIGNVGTFNPAMLVHGEQAIELHGEIPVEGTVNTTARVTARLRQGVGGGRRERSHLRRRRHRQAPLHVTRTRCSSAARAAGAATAGRPGPRTSRPTAIPTTWSPTTRGSTRRSRTGCRETATRCTPTPSSRSWAASRSPSSTVSAPTGSPAARCSTHCAGRIRRSSRAWRGGSRSPSSPAIRSR